MKEENRMMQDEMMNEEEIIGKEIEKELENTPEKNTEKNAQKEKMINLMNRYHSSKRIYEDTGRSGLGRRDSGNIKEIFP